MKRLSLAALVVGMVLFGLASAGAAPTGAPTGLTGIAQTGQVGLAWQAVGGASAYTVYRGTSATAITTAMTPAGGIAATAFNDSTAVNGTTYYYAVRSISGGVESANSLTVQAKPVARACSTGNAVVIENCYPGNTPWNIRNTATVATGGIEGYASAPSINKGESVDLKVNSDDTATFRIEIYRVGYYGGAGARLFSIVRGVAGARQPGCISDPTTGLLDCSNWSTSATLTTTSAWPSGVYALRLVREDTGTDNQILLTVRDDARASQVLYGVADTTYQAYNNYGGKSLYDFNSSGSNTVGGSPRAVKVSLDRPYEQPRSGQRDWFTRSESGAVTWLEREGYDVAYTSDQNLERNGAQVLNHKAYISPAHDEYWSASMRTALLTARDAGVGLFFSGSNEIYWKIRFEADAAGAQDRTEVAYKTTQSGPADPSGIHTGTWRDPAGANLPENALTGEMYVGDNDAVYYPFVVNAAQGSDRLFRYTGLDAQAPGASTSIGSNLVGWEWDARVANGFEPAGVKTLSGSPVTGQLIQHNGKDSIAGSTTTSMVKYVAPSGALVVTTGTNHWARGLSLNAEGVGEPDVRIQQITTNLLQDMGAPPTTPAADITLDVPQAGRPAAPGGLSAVSAGTDSIIVKWNAVAGASGYNVYRSLGPRDRGQPLGALASGSLVTSTSFTDTGLTSATTYYYVVTAVVSGAQSLASTEVNATTPASAGQPTRINTGGTSYTSLSGAVFRADTFNTGGSVFSGGTRAITGTSDPTLYQDERWGQFSYAIPVVSGTYDVRFHFVELYYGTAVAGAAGKRVFGMDIADTPASPDLSNIDIYAAVGKNAALVKTVSNVQVTDGTLNISSVYGAADDPEVAAIEVIPVSTIATPPSVTDTLPLAGATGVSRATHLGATFSRAMDSTTITASSFTLTGSGGAAVPATVSYDAANLQATLTPSSTLAYSTTYTAKLAATIKAADGTALASAVTWTFTTTDPVAPQVTSTFPTAGATGVSPSAVARAGFSRSLDPTTVNSTSVTLTGPGGTSVPVTVNYDDTLRSVSLSPTSALSFSSTYTARIGVAVTAVDGVPLASPVSWSFTTGPAPQPPPTLTSQSPAPGATAVARDSAVDVVFSRDLDPTSITSSTFTLSSTAGAVDATVTYDTASRTAHLAPTSLLAFSTTYTARIDSSVHAVDGTPLASTQTWTFTTTALPPPPTVTARTPAAGAGYVARSSRVTATFSRAMDPSTVTGANFTLTLSGGAAVPANVSYDATTNIATLTPIDPMAGGSDFSVRIAPGIAGADGVTLGTAVTWSFSTAACPCQLFSPLLVPAATGLSTQDGRTGAGPWSYELGVKFVVDQASVLNSIRYYRSPGESGTHVGTLWTANGVQLARTTFVNESSSGWQEQALATPVALQAGAQYVVSVNANAFFSVTAAGLASAIVVGPLSSVADGANGIYATASGVFPSLSYNTSNYFVDPSVTPAGDPAPPAVAAQAPASGATGVARSASVTATFSRAVDPASVTASSFTLSGPAGPVTATVTYDGAAKTATLTPSSLLSPGTSYTASLSSRIRGTEGTAIAATSWSFTTVVPPKPQVAATVPLAGATDIGPTVQPKATFTLALDPATVTASTFTLSSSTGAVAATVAYDVASNSATLTPSAPLTAGVTYTATLAGSIAATDGTQMGTPVSWQFTVTPPVAPTVTGTTPASGASFVARSGSTTATFSRSIDATTLTSAAFTLTASGATSPVTATVTYDAASKTATLTPTGLLAGGTVYTARIATSVRAVDGTALASAVSWSFTTAACPCQLFSPILTPAATGLSTQDGRTGAGPWSYELGVKVTVDAPTDLNAVRFYKSPGETGTHVARIWTSTGLLLAQTTFTGESASGWQQQTLASPLLMQPGSVYVISVNANAFFVVTGAGLAAKVTAGPMSTVVGANGVFATSGGTFPTSTYNSSNYLVDAVVVPDGDPAPPSVTSQTPLGGATGVSRTSPVTATFSRSLDPTSVTPTSFTLTSSGGPVAATVTYDDASKTATLTPTAALAFSTSYTATLSATVRAADGKPLAAPVTWSFTTAAPVRPQVVSTIPAAGAADIGSTVKPRATFTRSLDPATITSSTFTLTGPSGAVSSSVSYDDTTKTATLTPSAALSPGATYTATLAASIAATDGATLGTPQSWSFTVSQPTAFTVSAFSPASGATGVQRDGTATVTFSRSADPATVTAANVRLKTAAGAVVTASVTYDGISRTATITPGAWLSPQAGYTIEVGTAVLGADGTPLSAVATSSFTTGDCPCSLFAATAAPAAQGNSVRDGRTGAGPFTYEFGLKFTATRAGSLIGVRYYRDPGESGTHVGTLWSASGAVLATVTFTGETASGWQIALFSSPVTLNAGVSYVVSVNANATFGLTKQGLATQVSSGPVASVADGQNGVFASAAGQFPTGSYQSSNYFIDVVAR